MRVLAAALVVLLAGPRLAAAAPALEIESELVKQGVKAYDDLEYNLAVELLEKALGETLTRGEKILCYKTLAFAYVALGKVAAARGAFQRLLRVDESFELDRTVSPRMRAPFEEAKAALATSPAGAGPHLPTVTPALNPALPVGGQPLTVTVTYPGGVAEQMDLFYRSRGERSYARLLTSAPSGHFSLTIPGNAVKVPALEYYLVLLNADRVAVASAGNLGEPLGVDVQAPAKSIARKAWFWGMLAGIAVAGGVAAVLGVIFAPQPSDEALVTINVR